MPTTLYSPPLTPHRRAYTVTSSPVEPSLSTSSSPILRSSPLVNPAVANIVLPDIILNSPPNSRRGSATNGLLALGLGITMIPTLSHFKGKGKERGWNRDVEGRRSRSTSPKYVFSSILAPIQAATGSMGGASEKRIINIEDGQDGYDGYKTVGWKGKWRTRDEDGELTAWTVSAAMVLAMMALLCIGAMLAQSDANATNAFKDAKVIGWGDSVQGRRWGLRHANEVLNRRQAHGDWDDSFHGFDSIHHDALYEAERSAVSVSVKRDP